MKDKTVLDEIADKYQKAYDKIISFRDDMKKKMSEGGSRKRKNSYLWKKCGDRQKKD